MQRNRAEKYLPEYLSPARRKRIHPHSLRHTTAIHLLKAGADFATIPPGSFVRLCSSLNVTTYGEASSSRRDGASSVLSAWTRQGFTQPLRCPSAPCESRLSVATATRRPQVNDPRSCFLDRDIRSDRPPCNDGWICSDDAGDVDPPNDSEYQRGADGQPQPPRQAHARPHKKHQCADGSPQNGKHQYIGHGWSSFHIRSAQHPSPRSDVNTLSSLTNAR